MEKRTVLRLLLAVLAFAAVFAGARMWQEATYGRGPMESAAAPDGETREIAFVANAVGGTVSLIDVQDRRAIGEIDVTPDGPKAGFFRDPLQSLAQPMIEREGGLNFAQDTDLSRDGRVLFVARGHLGDVAAFDIATGDILWRTPVAGVRADHMAISPDGRRLYVSAMILGGNRVEVLDTASGETLGAFAAGDWPHDVHLSADGSRVYVASLGDMTESLAERGAGDNAYRVVVADARSLEVLRSYAFESGIRPFQVTRDETTLYAQLSNTHAVVARDLASGEPLGRIDLPVANGVTEDDWDFEAPHHGLALSPDERLLCAAGRASDYAALVDAAALTLIATVPVGDAPSWAAFAVDGSYCLLANTRSDDVSVVAVDEAAEVARIPAGRGPKHITVGRVPVSSLPAAR